MRPIDSPQGASVADPFLRRLGLSFVLAAPGCMGMGPEDTTTDIITESISAGSNGSSSKTSGNTGTDSASSTSAGTTGVDTSTTDPAMTGPLSSTSTDTSTTSSTTTAETVGTSFGDMAICDGIGTPPICDGQACPSNSYCDSTEIFVDGYCNCCPGFTNEGLDPKYPDCQDTYPPDAPVVTMVDSEEYNKGENVPVYSTNVLVEGTCAMDSFKMKCQIDKGSKVDFDPSTCQSDGIFLVEASPIFYDGSPHTICIFAYDKKGNESEDTFGFSCATVTNVAMPIEEEKKISN